MIPKAAALLAHPYNITLLTKTHNVTQFSQLGGPSDGDQMWKIHRLGSALQIFIHLPVEFSLVK
jgi:hypothetical protein